MGVHSIYLELVKNADDFYKANEDQIRKEIDIESANKIRKHLPKILEGNHMIWCRNGDVCSDTTSCSTTKCKYKKHKLDIVSGCAKCRQFQITHISSEWYTAYQTHDYGSVEDYKPL